MERTTMTPSQLPTSGKPAPVAPPAPEATYDLAWRYGRDLVRLNMVDPEKVSAFWEVTDATAARAQGRSGRLAVRLVRLEEGRVHPVSVHEGIFAVQSWYWEVEARQRYRAEVGWQSAQGFEVWLASNEVETPSLEPNVTADVVWRTRKGKPERVARGTTTFVTEDEEPSLRPRDAASAAGARRRQLVQEHLTLRPGGAGAWSRTVIPPRPPGAKKDEKTS